MEIDPATFRHLTTLHRLADELRRVTVWRAADRPRYEGATVHAVPTLVLCLEGTARIGAARGGRIDLGVGEALLLAPGAWHEHVPLRPGSTVWMQGFLASQSDVVLASADGSGTAMVPRQPYRRLYQQALDTADAGERRRLVGECLRQTLSDEMRPIRRMPPAVARMAHALWYGPRPELTVADAVRLGGLGHSQAHALFRSWFGTTPKRLLTDQRLAWAVEALREGLAPGAAAERAGFPSRVAFTRAFQARFGLPPRRWREAELTDAW